MPTAFSVGEDKVMTEVHKKLLPEFEKITGLKLFRTYNYLRIYQKGDILKCHSDRPSCEISCSICLGYDSNYCWELYLLNYDEEPVKVLLKPGDALIYKGFDLKHWRPKFRGKEHVQLFLHHIDKDGPNTGWKNAKEDEFLISV